MDKFDKNLVELLSDDRDYTQRDISKELSSGGKTFNDSLESILGVELTDRSLDENILEIFMTDSEIEQIAVDIAFESKMNEADALNERIDMNKEMPNIQEEEVTEAILIEGHYGSKIRDFIMNDDILPRGSIPLAFNINNEIIMIKKINPEPKYLYILKKVLVGFKFYYITEQGQEELSIYKFLGRPNLIGG